jgi:ketosteroid isomerase-like protein
MADAVVDALNARDFGAIHTLPFHAELEFHSAVAGSEGGIYSGPDWVQAWARDVDSTWEDFRLEVLEAHPVGDDRAVFVMRLTGIARTSRVPLDQRMSQLWTWRDGLAWRNESFTDPGAAFWAAGLASD